MAKKKPRIPKPGGNSYIDRQAKAKYERMRRQEILTQMCLDAAMIAANQTFNRKGEKVIEFAENMMRIFDEIARLTVEDAQDDPEFIYAKTMLDECLQSIIGDSFQPWDVRYGEGGEE